MWPGNHIASVRHKSYKAITQFFKTDICHCDLSFLAKSIFNILPQPLPSRPISYRIISFRIALYRMWGSERSQDTAPYARMRVDGECSCSTAIRGPFGGCPFWILFSILTTLFFYSVKWILWYWPTRSNTDFTEIILLREKDTVILTNLV